MGLQTCYPTTPESPKCRFSNRGANNFLRGSLEPLHVGSIPWMGPDRQQLQGGGGPGRTVMPGCEISILESQRKQYTL